MSEFYSEIRSKRYSCPDAVISSKDMCLKQAIAKWETILEKLKLKYTIENFGRKSCACCTIYHADDCIGCPIMKKSGLQWCKGTPFDNLSGIFEIAPTYTNIYTATKEVEFLKSLNVKTPAQRLFEELNLQDAELDGNSIDIKGFIGTDDLKRIDALATKYNALYYLSSGGYIRIHDIHEPKTLPPKIVESPKVEEDKVTFSCPLCGDGGESTIIIENTKLSDFLRKHNSKIQIKLKERTQEWKISSA